MGRNPAADEIGFVYKWTNKVNGKWYIGSHKGGNISYMGSGKRFQQAVRKYGAHNFSREFVYYGPNFRLYEETLLHLVDAAADRMSYNIHNWASGAASGDAHPKGMLGKTHPESYKARLRAQVGEKNPFYGKHHTEAAKKLMSKQRKGRRLSQETICKIVETRKRNGYKHSEETIKKMRASNLGQKRSQLTRERIRVARLGTRLTAETRAKISKAAASHRHSLESRQKMCESWKLRKMRTGKEV